MTDPIADMFTRIRNASAAKKAEVLFPMSKLKYKIAKIMEREGWIKKTEIIEGGLKQKKANFDQLKIVLKYKKNGKPYINSLKRISKPSLKIYAKKNDLPKVLNGLGISIVSTPGGLMTDQEARENNTGGEILVEIY